MKVSLKNGIAIAVLAGQLSGIVWGTHVMKVDGRRVEYARRGNGSPTIVFESGLGDGLNSWEPILDDVASFAPVFLYSRPGYGRSSQVKTPRTGEQIVEELRTNLRMLDINPPYILVGHSIGGTYMQLFAQRHPDEVAGLVLIDSRHADMTDRCRAELPNAPCDVPRAMQYLLPGAGRAEYARTDETFREVRANAGLRDMPLVVITAGKHSEGGGFARLWSELQDDLAKLSTRSRHIIAERSGHYVHRDEPQLVVSAIHELYASVAAR